MGKLTKSLLIVSVLCLAAGMLFVSGVINAGGAVALYVTLPAGAICLGLFGIFLMLEKESATYDADQRQLATAPQPADTAESHGCGRQPQTQRAH